MTRVLKFSAALLSVLVVLALQGCASKVDYDLTREFSVVPLRDVAIARVAWPQGRWESDEADAARAIGGIFREMTEERLKHLNYAVVPSGVVDKRIDSAGMDARVASPADVVRAAGADAVLFITVDRWDVDTVLTYKSLEIEATYELYSGTGTLLWRAYYSTSEADLGLDEERVRLTVVDIYEPRVQRFVDAVMATLPRNTVEAPPKRYFDWLQ